jgi:hypothetical protein
MLEEQIRTTLREYLQILSDGADHEKVMEVLGRLKIMEQDLIVEKGERSAALLFVRISYRDALRAFRGFEQYAPSEDHRGKIVSEGSMAHLEL